jgi:hypothetical protein
MFLDRHPRYRQRFRELYHFVEQPDFNERFYRSFEADWQELCEEWQVMVANLEYGYDVERSAIDFTPGQLSPRPLAEEGREAIAAGPTTSVTVAADRGWQNTGLRLDAGRKYRLVAAGRYRVGQQPSDLLGRDLHARPPHRVTAAGTMAAPTAAAPQPKIWWCEPGGVSIRYYQGRPLGVLLAVVRPDHPSPNGTSPLLYPTVVGLGTTLAPAETGTLFLKINDSAAELAVNAGELNVEVRRE